ncbi:MAG: glycoside hydrolase family 27 protein [Acidobacteriaceae bacterium]|nr:glycoside hydrolase family 27 protein [Acidobacteriaceae bacterium]
MRCSGIILALAILSLLPALAQPATPASLAPTPPMGWNSWDAYGLTITEAQFRANALVQAEKLKPFGWTYAIIDEGWFLKNPGDYNAPAKLHYQLDAFGRYIPVPSRFPSSENNGSFQNLGAYVHSLGLKFGIHIVRGIPRESVARNLPIEGGSYTAQDAADTSDACSWDPTNWGVRDTPAGQAWYDALLRQYATWGVDYLKVDCISANPYKLSEIRMIHRAILKTGRPILLSLSPGPTAIEHAAELSNLAQMWRISNDLWDNWSNPPAKTFPTTLIDKFALDAAWQPFVKPGNWPDADMLPLGHLGPVPGYGPPRDTRFTHDEQRTLLTLWSIARSPLILGANLTALDAWTTALLTNPAVLAVNQRGHDQHQAARDGNLVVWTTLGEPGEYYLALFNLGNSPMQLTKPYAAYGLPALNLASRELWTDQRTPASKTFQVELPPHGSVLLKLQAPK